MISPPFYRLMGSHYNGIHLGLCYIASVLNKKGYDTKIYNADFLDSVTYSNQKELFDNFDVYIKILNDPAQPVWQEVADMIRKASPEYIGIQMYTGTFKSAQMVASIAKSLNPEVKIVVGGTHPSLDPLGTIKCEHYDYVIRGEGEYTFTEILEGKDRGGIKGLTFRDDNGKIVSNPPRDFIDDLDSLPFPARDRLFNGNGNTDTGAIITGRGCPFQCSYCASPELSNKKTRYRSVENVLSELEFMTKRLNISLVRFQDDTFTLNKSRTSEICEGILRKGLAFQWVCDTRVDRIDRELLKLMKRAGCIRVKIGVESGSDEILKKVRKGVTVERIRRGVGVIKEAGIPLTIYLMIGFPGETDEDVKKTIRFAREIDADYNSLSVVAPYYGTGIYKNLVKDGFEFAKNNWEYFFHQSRAMIMNTKISRQVIDEFFGLNERNKERV
ncbi:MAG TPA: hypothetical protein DDW94_10685 [Deltaproteobacteria bacterium]|nr:MAG: hypothetical protein A2Z79_11690 [Deltaproteobacteria bacterium GWA2_55_82]OGQ63529.1 MAG: hypothetical protein A3I81_05880 [Deltaproteobacteria bacterium RIFCSPLOWO2_02_FULL_55_12]OIJ74911.1 MAG: hypothetical protein A2V21_311935 [Deltaproteobacteria bacterium GWC2_55_46]HBG47435.1 hypothetical protein [Deltaproteobacteria bacterium]HCY11451.1 hypothetical protein [Deltaproteobacteria bacterium]